MSTAAFPSPAAEMAEMNRIQYEMEYTEGINQRMRVPEKLKVAPPNADLEQSCPEGGLPNASVTMQVPERIVVAGMFSFRWGVLTLIYLMVDFGAFMNFSGKRITTLFSYYMFIISFHVLYVYFLILWSLSLSITDLFCNTVYVFYVFKYISLRRGL